LLTNN